MTLYERKAIGRELNGPPRCTFCRRGHRVTDQTTVARRRGSGGTLMTEPIVVVRGKHLNYFRLVDQDGSQLGLAVPDGRNMPGVS